MPAADELDKLPKEQAFVLLPRGKSLPIMVLNAVLKL
jgi:hypothetical protein